MSRFNCVNWQVFDRDHPRFRHRFFLHAHSGRSVHPAPSDYSRRQCVGTSAASNLGTYDSLITIISERHAKKRRRSQGNAKNLEKMRLPPALLLLSYDPLLVDLVQGYRQVSVEIRMRRTRQISELQDFHRAKHSIGVTR